MAWTFRPNCHVRIYLNDVLPPGPPVGAFSFDGSAQQLVPLMAGSVPSPFRVRVVLDGIGVVITKSDIQAAATQCWLEFRDDVRASSQQWWKIIDMSYSYLEQPPASGIFTAVAQFLVCELSR